MVRDDRIVSWNIAEETEMLLESGYKNPSEIAKRLNLMDSVKNATANQQVLQIDVRKYLAAKGKAKSERLNKSLAHSAQGREVIEQAREIVGWMMEQITPLQSLMPRAQRIVEYHFDQAEAAMEAVKNGEDPDDHHVSIPERDIRALRDLLGMFRDVVGDVKNDEKITQLLKAGEVNITQNQGISMEEMFERINGLASYLSCPSCGFKSFDETHTMGAFARFNNHRKKSDVLEAERLS